MDPYCNMNFTQPTLRNQDYLLYYNYIMCWVLHSLAKGQSMGILNINQTKSAMVKFQFSLSQNPNQLPFNAHTKYLTKKDCWPQLGAVSVFDDLVLL